MTTSTRPSTLALDARWRLAAAGLVSLAFWGAIAWALGWV